MQMRQKQRVAKSAKDRRTAAAAKTARVQHKPGRHKSLSLKASVEETKQPFSSMEEALRFYKPLKKPVTFRLDADVLAWFKKDGKRYQTRINRALREVMEREMKQARE